MLFVLRETSEVKMGGVVKLPSWPLIIKRERELGMKVVVK